MAQESLLTRDVFVAGGTPVVTYNPRTDQQLEQRFTEYLSQSGKALCVTGPTKCGKSVLVRRFLSEANAVWIDGNDLTSIDVFWRKIVDFLNLYDQVEIQSQAGVQSSTKAQGGVVAPFVSVTAGVTSGSSSGSQVSLSRSRAEQDVAREALKILTLPVVVDDFHYVPVAVKKDVARAIKSIISNNPVVLIAVNSDAFEAVRAEPDLVGRIWQLEIRDWKLEELHQIARSGFDALNLLDPSEVIGTKLAEESYRAPFLMQQLCFDFVSGSEIYARADTPVSLTVPENWSVFLTRIARRTKPPIFDGLLRGPKVHGQPRVDRHLSGGGTTDIYGATLYAIARSPDASRMDLANLRATLDRELTGSVSSQEVTNALHQMSKIADQARGDSDPVLLYRREQLHVLDPFLSFYLRRSGWESECIEWTYGSSESAPELPFQESDSGSSDPP